MSEVNKVYGVGQYSARWVQRSSLVEITTSGLLPCLNYSASLEKRPERVLPPMWDMIFYTQDVCLAAVKPFYITQQFAMDEVTDGQKVILYDATGQVEVPIERDGDIKVSSAAEGIKRLINDMYIVYAQLPKHSGTYKGCIIGHVNSAVLGIYYRAYGPASRAECDKWLSDNCAEADFELASGEIPWPLYA
ncbi:hypothetical protein [uncultured Jannaschia sp.]|uniref:hypothetical protein n=1 Tax=uncultured Jannaschia sp. TaxID=293347 RepID=UPI002637F63B|nr:hypothetical protein [uncultured Jannaschia sp.]